MGKDETVGNNFVGIKIKMSIKIKIHNNCDSQFVF